MRVYGLIRWVIIILQHNLLFDKYKNCCWIEIRKWQYQSGITDAKKIQIWISDHVYIKCMACIFRIGVLRLHGQDHSTYLLEKLFLSILLAKIYIKKNCINRPYIWIITKYIITSSRMHLGYQDLASKLSWAL